MSLDTTPNHSSLATCRSDGHVPDTSACLLRVARPLGTADTCGVSQSPLDLDVHDLPQMSKDRPRRLCLHTAAQRLGGGAVLGIAADYLDRSTERATLMLIGPGCMASQ